MCYSIQSEDNLWELTLLPPCEWVSETELEWSGLVVSAFAHCDILPALFSGNL